MRRHKYGAKRAEVDGHKFDSKAEARRYGELKMLEKAGKIVGLKVHPKFGLRVDMGRRGKTEIGFYEADFHYLSEGGEAVVEDVKGVRTPIYRWKKKHFEAEYGIEITEVDVKKSKEGWAVVGFVDDPRGRGGRKEA